MSAPRSAEPTLNEPDITLWPNEQYGEKKQDHADPWISSGAAGMEEARDQEAHGHHVKDEAVRAEVGEAILHRGLKTRHMTMISIGSVIGTGLFLGTAGSLARAGTLGILLGYAIVSTIVYCMMICLGEMITFMPLVGGHVKLASRIVDPAFGFAVGFNYWLEWALALPAEISAASVIVGFWDSSTNSAAFITVFLAVALAINLSGSRVFGESEFWFCSIKVLLAVGLIILGVVITSGGTPSGETIGFRFWRDPGPFVQYHGIDGSLGRFLGTFSVCIQAIYSYNGVEMIGMTAGESTDPRRAMPRATKTVFFRMAVFYLATVFVVGLCVPSNYPGLGLGSTNANTAPFVIAATRAGIKVLPSVVNAGLLTAAVSAGSSDLYGSSRTLFTMAYNRQAPAVFARVNKWGVPWVAILGSFWLGPLAYMSVQTSAAQAFNYLTNLTSIAGAITWFAIGLTYIRFRKGLRAQGIEHKDLPYHNRLNTRCWPAYYVCGGTLILGIFSGFSVFLEGNWVAATFVTQYLLIPFIPLCYVLYKYFWSTTIVSPEEMDFVSGVRTVDEATYRPQEKAGFFRGIARAFV